MPRSRRDRYKRECAQALNHLAAAILDVNVVYEAMARTQPAPDEMPTQPVTAQEPGTEEAKPQNGDNFTIPAYDEVKTSQETVKASADDLYTVMMGIAASREKLLTFIYAAWLLDEETITVYMG